MQRFSPLVFRHAFGAVALVLGTSGLGAGCATANDDRGASPNTGGSAATGGGGAGAGAGGVVGSGGTRAGTGGSGAGGGTGGSSGGAGTGGTTGTGGSTQGPDGSGAGTGGASNDASRSDGAAGSRDASVVDAARDASAPDAARPTEGGAGDGAVAGPPNVLAMGSGLVEVFVNGASLGKAGAARALVSVAASLVTGENEIVVRATNGAAARPFVQLQAGGAFGKAGSSNRWKAKVAVGTEATDATGPWAMLNFDDSTWASATDVNVAPAAPFPTDGPAHGIWTATAADATVLLRLKLYLPPNLNAANPTGFASGVTGGRGGPTVTVTTPAQLVQALADNTARIVQVSGNINFIGTEGPVSASSCFQSQCADGTFEYITNDLGACDSAGKATFNVTFDKAGTIGIPVGSNKTIIGLGPNATIQGKGLRLVNAVSNIIVRNLTITNINPQIVWGGDAIDIDNASNVWIDHVRVSLVGRQFFVTGFGPASNLTLSWNEFDGRTQWSATCNGAHYWVMLIAGSNDTITMSNNWIHHTSGRGPHAAGLTTTFDYMQFANDFYEIVPGHAADPALGSNLLYEGTVFNQVTTPIVVEATMAGTIYAPLASTVAGTNAACQAALGRACVANTATPQNGTFPLDQAVLTAFGTRRAGLVVPYPAAEVPNAVPHLAGPGHI